MGTFLAVQWLRFYASSSGGTGSVPGQGTKIPHAVEQLGQHAITTEPHNKTESLRTRVKDPTRGSEDPMCCN